MIEVINSQLYKIEIPLPNNPLKSLNSYVIKSKDRNLLIDTGMNREECITAMEQALEQLEIDLNITDIFITHLHSDHTGLVPYLAKENSRVYCSRVDAAYINSSGNWQGMLGYALKNGFPADEDTILKHPGYKYAPGSKIDFTIVKEKDEIIIGDYKFTCISTPGHTRGHMCLYEPYKKILVSGDHILYKITPNISLWTDEDDPLKDYLASLEKTRKLNVDLVLPAHRMIFNDLNKRVEELKDHHNKRLRDIMAVIKDNTLNAFQVASKINWDLSYSDWNEFPTPQKWFATGEVISHLKYLENRGMVKRSLVNDKLAYILI
ncbi:MBL-fold metallo-hydrolase superfamily [Candidatus Syntrophocurvum alkaliphilum]|uniref:MBL-fold metallo-hydrolase superfamily n=1 Tax=Candidatus Syntrophocurvum alkaliphilum TaxID=2293317 RepID=A0A6I6DC27_9FIRM|nr:MBL fold metallo-hydrolase [Candidatus Syntrophocurvum alkaliphilum]QGU00229.1 MBL-fold metallo-hydrolase superfamily [Candidatus Syntrophocurvum alkaliphilum]